MADKMRQSNIAFGDPRYTNFVSVTRSTQSSVAGATSGASARDREEERRRVASMKAALQSSAVQLGDDSLDETTWRSSNNHTPATRQEQEAARGQLDPAVQNRIRKSNVKLGCERVQKTSYTSVSHSAHGSSAPRTAAQLQADKDTAAKRKAQLTGSSISSW